MNLQVGLGFWALRDAGFRGSGPLGFGVFRDSDLGFKVEGLGFIGFIGFIGFTGLIGFIGFVGLRALGFRV